MKTIDRQWESLSTKGIAEITQPWFDKNRLAPMQGPMTLNQHIRAQGVLASIQSRELWPSRTKDNSFSVRHNIALR